jgi:hypothetical protein
MKTVNLSVIGILLILSIMPASLAEISCSVIDTTSESCSGTLLLRLSDYSNAHAENSSQGIYDYAVCCTELYGGTLGTTCLDDPGKNISVIKLSNITNAHAGHSNVSSYENTICLSNTANITMGYDSDCSTFDTCLFSLSGNDNAHLGNCTAYNSKVCASTHNLTIDITQGNQSSVKVLKSTTLAVRMFDVASGEFPSGVSGKIFVETSPGIYDNGLACTTDINGECSVNFIADCTYSGGTINFRGGPFNDALYNYKNSTEGSITLDANSCSGIVTFEMEFNLSGSESAEVDGYGTGTYPPFNLTNFYTCMQDASISGIPAFGIVFAGDILGYISLESGNSFAMKISQNQAGNKFLLPVTRNGCDAIKSKVNSIKNGILPQPFVSFLGGLKATGINMILSYPEVDIVGDFTKSGTFTLLMEKVVSGGRTQIIFRG